MHIQHPGSPNSSQSEDDAATKIQAGFRGYRVRKQIRQNKTSTGGTASNSGMGQQRSVGKKNGSSLEDNSAAKIQAGVRGFLVRKRQKVATEAATKIQASFRGFKTRKDLKTTKKEK
ncbi:abnormal spindle-like microcephaly-associated protein homolog [Wyeomyia smithii]|uniref:abnormal spindle-like microcephaly-associated protein homolog n=1 Tax=Wyeomyia smithii TaxID=174621 RepID=UPI002467B6A6|nr:abnormal spindle-like microcephaly-associated protein homolog [Wyeomyia smithii]